MTRNIALGGVLGALLLSVVACGGGGLLGFGGDSPAPSPAELERALMDELARLGKDPSKLAASAPKIGAEVFDLTGSALDPDEGGPAPPNGVTLTWTDRLPGDYDNNGLVSISDLTTLGARFGQRPEYRDPASVDGIAVWPEGHPADAGSAAAGSVPEAGSGAANWLLARVDGDGNALVNISDITPLAVHLGEQLTGYRVYRKAPGAADFELLPDPADGSAALSITRLSVTGGDNGRPVRYSFADFFSGDGIYEYRVVPYCAADDTEGQGSRSFWVDSRTGQPITGGLSAILSADVTSGTTPLLVNFDASFSTGNIVRYEWDFDGNGSFDRVTGNVPHTDFFYVTNSTYAPVVRITDNKGAMATATIVITALSPAGNQPPTAALVSDLTSGTAPLSVAFNGSGSADLDGSILSYEWDFNGDGTFDLNSGTVPTANFAYASAGTFLAQLRVTDDSGGTATAGLAITVNSPSGNQPPLAALTADTTSGPAPLTVNFNGAGSVDLDGTILTHEWDFEGDGSYDMNSGTVATVSHTYHSSATHIVRLRVTDNDGAQALAQLTVSVQNASGNNPPLAALTALPTSGIAPLSVDFNGGGSIDTDGSILSHEWDFDGDGAFDVNSGTVATTSHSYAAPGTYIARLRVTDDDGATALAMLTISVQNAAGNNPPLAALTADFTAGTVPLAVSFDGSGSTDIDGMILTHEWDYDGDGTYDLNSGTVPAANHTYTAPGVFTARLRVTDDGGSTATATLTIDASGGQGGNQPPSVSLGAAPTTGQVDFSSTGTAPNITYTNEGLAVTFTATATDPDGSIAKYEWDFEGDGIFDFTSGTDNTTTFSYLLAGTYNARVRVLDNQNATGLSQAVPITVENRAPFVHLQHLPGAAAGGGVETPLTLQLATAGSTDVDGTIVKYEWDMNGDGVFTYTTFTDPDTGQLLPTDIDSGGQNFITRVYSSGVASRTDTYGVRVTDSAGATTYTSVQFDLQDAFDEIENNDTAAAATQFNVGSAPQVYAGNMGGQSPDGYDGDETDWYRFSLAGPRSVDLTLDGFTSAVDLNMRVYAGDGTTLLASGLKVGHDQIDNLIFLSAGTFFVKVSRFSGDQLNNHDYDLTVDASALAFLETEANNTGVNNDTSGSAQFLSAFAPNGHLLDFYGRFSTDDNNDDDSDWYSWTVNGGIDLSITLDFKHLDADLDLYLVDDNGQTVAASTSSTDGESIFISHTDSDWHSGTWFVRVARAGGGAAAYQLDLLGGGTVTTYTIHGEANSEVGVSNVGPGVNVTWKDINTGTNFGPAVTDNSGEWTIDLPDGQYLMHIPTTSSILYITSPGGNIVLETLDKPNPQEDGVRLDIIGGAVVYEGENITYQGDTIPLPILTGETNIT